MKKHYKLKTLEIHSLDKRLEKFFMINDRVLCVCLCVTSNALSQEGFLGTGRELDFTTVLQINALLPEQPSTGISR